MTKITIYVYITVSGLSRLGTYRESRLREDGLKITKVKLCVIEMFSRPSKQPNEDGIITMIKYCNMNTETCYINMNIFNIRLGCLPLGSGKLWN